MHANLDREAPGLGAKILLQQSVTRQVAAQQDLSPRHAAYVAAFKELGLCRAVAHTHMSSHQVSLELVVGNHSVGDTVTGASIRSPLSLPARVRPRCAGATLGDVGASLTLQPAVDGIVLPAGWLRQLQCIQQRHHQQPHP